MAVIAGRGVAAGRAGATAAGGDIASGSANNTVSQREDLANFISMITRDETPFMSSIGKTKATAIFHEWQLDALETPGNSRITEGTDYVLPGSTAGIAGGSTGAANGQTAGGDARYAVVGPNRTRLGNYAQINGKSIAVSGTRRAIDQAGVADEYAYQLKKRGTELRRDVEFDLVQSFNVSSAAAAGRTMGGYQAWINKAEAIETGQTLGGNVKYVGDYIAPSNGGVGSSTVGKSVANDAAADKGSLSLSDIDSVMQTIYQNGGKASKIMVSPKLRRDFSDLMVTDSGVRRNIDMDGKLRQSVDIYMSDFGDLMVVPNYIMGLSNTVDLAGTGSATVLGTEVADFSAFIYDPMWFAIATLRPLQEVDVGQRGDSTIGMMVEEMTLEVKNPTGCGAIYGLN